MSSIITLTNDNFTQEVINTDKPVLVDFWASWCGPCRMLSPIIDEISAETDKIKFCKLNIDDQPELAQRYMVSSIPTLILFENGEPVRTSVGVRPKSELLEFLNLK